MRLNSKWHFTFSDISALFVDDVMVDGRLFLITKADC